jgi:hypothetical protein
MSMLTLQQIFDKSVGGVIAQGALSNDGEGLGSQCRYRTQSLDGKPLACGVGQVIPDNLYVEDIEGWAVTTVGSTLHHEHKASETMRACLEGGGIDTGNKRVMRLLTEIQAAHDNARSLDEFKANARKVAVDFALADTVPGEAVQHG